jgi:hypothetical protein
VQRNYIEGLGGVQTLSEIDTSHVVIVSEPERLAHILSIAAGYGRSANPIFGHGRPRLAPAPGRFARRAWPLDSDDHNRILSKSVLSAQERNSATLVAIAAV